MILDIFNTDAFGTVELTEAINVVPNTYGRIRELGLFAAKGVSTTSVAVEMKNGVLNLLPQTQRGGPASQGSRGKRNMRSFQIPNFSHEDALLAEAIQNIRAFGEENQLQAIQDEVNDMLATMRAKHAITLEWLRAGALRGTIMDSDGSTILNLFTEFGVAEKVVDFKLGTAGTDVPAKCREICRHVEDNLKGEVFTGVHSLVSSGFFDKLVAHASVKEAYNFQNVANFLREDQRRGFKFHGITFEEYLGSATDEAGTKREFIPAGDARFFPMGTQQTFRNYFAPADFMETVNTRGLELYAKQEIMKFDRGVEIHTQMNPLPLITRPALLVRGHSSD